MDEVKELNKTDAIPLYIQVANLIKSKIKTEEYKPGEKLPRELTLAENYNVSRITIRSALDLLANEEVIVKKQGKGTFVTDNKKTVSMNSLQGFYSLLVKSGGNISTTLRNFTIGLPSSEIQDTLEIKDDQNILTMERLYNLNDQAIALTKTFFYKDIYLNKEETETLTAYGILVEKLNEIPFTSKYNLSVIKGTEEIRSILNITEGTPIQLLKRTTFNMNDKPLECTFHFIQPEHCNLEFTLKKSDENLEDLRIIN